MGIQNQVCNRQKALILGSYGHLKMGCLLVWALYGPFNDLKHAPEPKKERQINPNMTLRIPLSINFLALTRTGALTLNLTLPPLTSKQEASVD